LFLPNERTTLDQRIARLQFKIVQDDYHSSIQLSAVRQKLEDAQVKYRTATEEVSMLKQRVTQEEVARKVAEQAQREAAGKLEQTQCYLDEEQAALQQQVAQLSQQEHTHSAAADEAAKTFPRQKAELEAMRGRLEEANQKYREATEQVSTLKQQVAQLSQQGHTHSAATDEATKNLLRLKAEFEAMRGKLGRPIRSRGDRTGQHAEAADLAGRGDATGC
jgi:chromosome segregation ATPase